MNEQISDAVFVHVDTILNVATGKRDDFDAMIERETISIQNICFLDVAVSAFDDCFDVTDDVSEDESFEIDFDWWTDDVSINADSFDVNVAEDVDIVIIAFDARSAITQRQIKK